MRRLLCALGLILAAVSAAQAQDVYVPYNQDVYHWIDRYQILYGDKVPQLQTAVRPYGRQDVAELAEVSARNARTAADQFNAQYLLNDNWNYTDESRNDSERPIWNTFYTNKTDLYHFRNEHFTVRVNPVLHLELGLDNQTDGVRYVNTRGVQIEGSIDERFGYYAFIGENQARFPGYVNERIARDNVVPHEGFWKRFKEDGYDFITARGYLNYALSDHVEIQLGHDRHVIGDGYRSMVYSDYAPPAFFLKLNTRVWKLHYMNLFQELISEFRRTGRDELFPKKYMALHRLGVNVTDNFNIGLFEQIVFSRGKGRFELQYLNPVIFYRSIEQGLGSEDNAMLGADFRWNIMNRVQLYGQLMLDEFLLREVKAGNGWWGNKQAGQIGAKYIDAFGLGNLDLQGEVNIIRPYTYQHTDQFTNYQHYNQPLAHPMGANLYELVGVVRYQPIPRLNLTGKAIATRYGQDTDSLNYGGNVLYSYLDRVSGYGNEIAQGVTTNQLYLDLTASFQLRHNVFLDLKQVVRRSDAEINTFDSNTYFTSFAFRWNIPQRLHEF
jgi:opacity protein-like surface antigen